MHGYSSDVLSEELDSEEDELELSLAVARLFLWFHLSLRLSNLCLLPGCSGPLLFQVGRQHPSAFVIFKPFHDGVAVPVCRLLLVPPSVGEVSASPFAISQVFPVFILGYDFRWPCPNASTKV